MISKKECESILRMFAMKHKFDDAVYYADKFLRTFMFSPSEDGKDIKPIARDFEVEEVETLIKHLKEY